MEGQTIVEIEFGELSDDTLVEMIEDPADPTQALLAVYRDGSVRYTKSLDDGGRTLVPLSRTDRAVSHVCFPQGAEPYGQALDLQKHIYMILKACLDLEQYWLCAIVAFIISTCFAKKLPVAPYLAFVGPPGSGKTTAMRVLNLLCYRSLLTADITSAAFHDISHRVHPTIIIDETLTAGNPRELIHLLKASSTPGFVSLRKDNARLAYGPKVFSWLELPNDAALNSRCIIVPMRRTSRTDLKSPNGAKVMGFAKQIRKRLLQFRLEQYQNVSVPKIPLDVQLSGRPLDIYRALALPFGQDPEMCKLLGYVISLQDQIQAPVLSPVQGSAILVLYNLIHKYPETRGYAMSELTRIVNWELKKCGEPCGLNERNLGNILTSLSFTNRTRRNKGYFLWLERSDRERIHRTARDYGICPDPTENCDICAPTSVMSATNPAVEPPSEKKVPPEEAWGERLCLDHLAAAD